jgi:N-alpha-acetyltransferase 35, NatC auxiliary subunit
MHAGNTPSDELVFERLFLSALEHLCTGMFVVRSHPHATWAQCQSPTFYAQITIPDLNYCRKRLELNFKRRYKWALRSEYSEISSAVVVPPDLDHFLAACAAILEVSLPVKHFQDICALRALSKDESYSMSTLFSRAKEILEQMSNTRAGWAGQWHKERLQVRITKRHPNGFTYLCAVSYQFMQDLSRLADELARSAPSTIGELMSFDRTVLDWSATKHRWFPGVRSV